MKCPNQLCQSVIEGERTRCPRCSVPIPGAVVGDRFALKRLLRSGPVVLTFEAWDETRLETVHVRVFVPRFGRSVAHIKGEIKALKELPVDRSPGILAFDWEADFPWIAEGELAGPTLADRLLRGSRPLAEKEVVEIMRETARVLERLHTLSVVHRDIRPESVAYRADGRLMLGTPAWERELMDRPRGRNRGVYTAPEASAGHATPQTDLYSVGVLAIHLLSGLNPEGLYRPDVRTFAWAKTTKASARLIEIVDGLVAYLPSERIQSAGRLRELLLALDERPPEVLDPALEEGPLEGEPPAGDGARPGTLEARNASANRGGLTREEEAETPRRPWRWLAGLGLALASLLAALAGFLRRVVAVVPSSWTINGLKILVAMGLLAGVLLARLALVHRKPGGLPPPVIGHNDDGIALSWPSIFASNSTSSLVVRILPGQPGSRTYTPEPSGANATAPGPGGSPSGQSTSGRPPDPAAEPGGPSGGQPPSGGQAPSAGQPPPPGTAGPSTPGSLNRSDQPAKSAPLPTSLGNGTPSGAKGPSSQQAHPQGSPVVPPKQPAGAPGGSAANLGSASRYFIRVNTTYHTLTLYRDGRYFAQFPITTGKGASTPQGRFYITKKVTKPSDGRIPGGSPRNPFGSDWLGLDVHYPGGKGIGIHGTDRPDQMGMSASGGCVRLRNRDVRKLYRLVPSGTPVEIL